MNVYMPYDCKMKEYCSPFFADCDSAAMDLLKLTCDCLGDKMCNYKLFHFADVNVKTGCFYLKKKKRQVFF